MSFEEKHTMSELSYHNVGKFVNFYGISGGRSDNDSGIRLRASYYPLFEIVHD